MDGVSYNKKSILEKLDNAPTSGSSNAVKSDGVKTYVDTTADTINNNLATERQARIDGDAQLGARITDVAATQTADTFVFKGSVAAVSNLPAASGANIGDTYYVESEHCNYSCYQDGTSKAWTKSSGTDLNQMKDNIATDWQNTHATKIYKAGDVVMYNDQVYVRKADATTYDSVWTASEWTAMSVGDQVSNVNNALDEIREHTSNLYDPYMVSYTYFTSSARVTTNDNTRMVFIPCKPSTRYYVSKTAGHRFTVGYTTTYPSPGTTVSGVVVDYTGSRLSITTGADAAYLVSWVYSASYDTGITPEEMLSSIMIQEGVATDEYVPPYSAVDLILRDTIDSDGVLCCGALENHSDLDDLDGVDHNGYYILRLASEYDHDPIGSGVRRLLFVLPDTDVYYIQIIFDLSTGCGFLRDHTNAGGWGEWVHMGDFLGVLESGSDLNDVNGNYDGYYTMAYSSVYGNDPFGPKTRRILRVLRSKTASYYQQHMYDADSGRMMMRYHTSTGWSNWIGGSSASQPALTSGAAYNVRFPRNTTGASNPYTTEQKVVTLLHFSDVHESSGCLGTLMTWANEHTSLYDNILCTGDLVNYYNEETGMDYMAFWQAVQNTENILVTIGNHDAKDQSSSSVPNWTRKSMSRSRELYQYGLENWGVTAQTGKTYWYKDYENSNLRLIGLDTTVVPSGIEDVAQQSWLTTILEEARTAEKCVVIAQHYPPIEADGSASPQISSDFSAENRSVPHNVYMCMDAAYPRIVQDFIDAGGEFVCWLAGHAHNDHVAYHRQYPAQVYFVVTSLWNDLRYTDQARIQGTPSYVAANLIGFDTNRKLVKIARVGANSNADLKPRDFLVWNYSTRTIVRQTSGE